MKSFEEIVKDNESLILTVLIIGCLYFIVSGFYTFTVKTTCDGFGGELVSFSDKGLRCVNITNLDVCNNNGVIENNNFDLNFDSNFTEVLI